MRAPGPRPPRLAGHAFAFPGPSAATAEAQGDAAAPRASSLGRRSPAPCLPHAASSAGRGPLGRPSGSRDVVPRYRVRPSIVAMVLNSTVRNRCRTSPSSRPQRAPGRSLEHSSMRCMCVVDVHPNENKKRCHSATRSERAGPSLRPRGPQGPRAQVGVGAGERQLRVSCRGRESGRLGRARRAGVAVAAQGTAWALRAWSGLQGGCGH